MYYRRATAGGGHWSVGWRNKRVCAESSLTQLLKIQPYKKADNPFTEILQLHHTYQIFNLMVLLSILEKGIAIVDDLLY